MKILQINIFGNLSTGKIAVDIYKTLVRAGHEGMIAYARGTIEEGIPSIKIGTEIDVKVHGLMTRITDRTGFYSKKATWKFIEDIRAYNPDMIHLHNIHGYYLNIEILFGFLKEYGKPVVWTLHDCWAFTGHCAYFDFVKCDKWETGCYDCEQKRSYPASLMIDNSKKIWQKKKELFSGLNMKIVTPSYWLKQLVEKSFLNQYPVEVIHNGIDLKIFQPKEGNFRENYNLEDKYIILGVASSWDKRKGLRDFIELEKLLDNKYKIVLVGLTKKQIEELPETILGIERTNNVEELVDIYTTANVFFNPTYEDNYPTVNLEAIACGTNVITYNTGGSPETLHVESGKVIKQGDIESALIEIEKNVDVGIEKDSCQVTPMYDKEACFRKYIEIYS